MTKQLLGGLSENYRGLVVECMCRVSGEMSAAGIAAALTADFGEVVRPFNPWCEALYQTYATEYNLQPHNEELLFRLREHVAAHSRHPSQTADAAGVAGAAALRS